jgi:hypothetical protein
LKIFSRTIGPILTRLGTHHVWVKGIQVCSKEGGSLFSRGYNSERLKIHWKFLKIIFSKTNRPKSIKLDKNCPWVKGIQVFFSKKRSCPLQRGDNHKNVKNGVGSFKNIFLQNHWTNFNQSWHKSYLVEEESIILKEGG